MKHPGGGRAPRLAFVGSQTSGAGEGIGVLAVGEGEEPPERLALVSGTENPSFLAFDPLRSVLYAVQETAVFRGRAGGGLVAYACSAGDGSWKLEPIASRETFGTFPCHVALSPGRAALLVANYGDGVLAAYRLDASGLPGEAEEVFRFSGRGPVADRQECAHAHSAAYSPDGRFIVLADLGRDTLVRYSVDPATEMPVRRSAKEFRVKPGSGPRHFAFRGAGSGTTLYVVEELSSELSVLRWDRSSGDMALAQTVSTLPDGFTGTNLAADVHIHPSGEWLYCSNRGHDSIARFRILADGALAPAGHSPCGGSWPRNFAVDPSGLFLFVANSRSNRIARFGVGTDGELSPIDPPIPFGEPTFIDFLRP